MMELIKIQQIRVLKLKKKSNKVIPLTQTITTTTTAMMSRIMKKAIQMII